MPLALTVRLAVPLGDALPLAATLAEGVCDALADGDAAVDAVGVKLELPEDDGATLLLAVTLVEPLTLADGVPLPLATAVCVVLPLTLADDDG